MKLFKSKGFDTIIGTNLVVNGDVILHGTTVVDGFIDGCMVHKDPNAPVESTTILIVNRKATIRVTHDVTTDVLEVAGDLIAGTVDAHTLVVKDGGSITAAEIAYGTLRVEGAGKVEGSLRQRDTPQTKAAGGPL
jgi:cytoskeletal protein CcmA (bactofilin family)